MAEKQAGKRYAVPPGDVDGVCYLLKARLSSVAHLKSHPRTHPKVREAVGQPASHPTKLTIVCSFSRYRQRVEGERFKSRTGLKKRLACR